MAQIGYPFEGQQLTPYSVPSYEMPYKDWQIGFPMYGDENEQNSLRKRPRRTRNELAAMINKLPDDFDESDLLYQLGVW